MLDSIIIKTVIIFLLGNVFGIKVYSINEAIVALNKGYDIKTIQLWSNCQTDGKNELHGFGGLKVDYYFQKSTKSNNTNKTMNMINYYNTE